jgi:hypothetical protein
MSKPFFKNKSYWRQVLIYCAVSSPALRRKTISSQHSFVSSARRNLAAAVERDSAETQTGGNKRVLIVVMDTGGCCRWWREWELIKRLDTPRGGTFVAVAVHAIGMPRQWSKGFAFFPG